MNKLPIISAKRFYKYLIAYGCIPISSKGSHFKVKYPKSGKSAPIPVHGNRDIKRNFMNDILSELGIDINEFNRFVINGNPETE